MVNKPSLYLVYLATGALCACSGEGPNAAGTGTVVGAGGSSGNAATGADATGTASTTAGSSDGAAAGSVGGATSASAVVGAGGASGTTTTMGGASGESTNGTTGMGGASVGGATSMGGSAGSGGLMGAGGATGSTTGGDGGTGGTASACPSVAPLTGGQEYCSNGKGDAGSGYGYELWADGGGSGCMTVHRVDAAFSATWNGVEDFLARVGLDFNQTQTHTQIGTITAEFAETKMDDGGLTYIGIYGWTVSPLREFYILDDWGSEKPGGTSSDGTPRDFAGTLTADGETYDVWTKLRENKPAITGNSETFEQYFSIRQTARQCGTISISEHFTAWEGMDLELGNLHEIKLLAEAQFNSGTIQFTTATIVAQ